MTLTAAAVSLRAPGDDLLCGTADRYDVLDRGGWRPSPVRPTAAGTIQAIPVPAGARYAAVRAVDEAGNVGRPAAIGR